MQSTSTIWGGVVPLDMAASIEEAILARSRQAKLRRPFVILESGSRGALPRSPVIDRLEAGGLAASPHEVGDHHGIDVLAECIAAFHFEACDGVVGIGGAGVIDLAKSVAALAGENRTPSAIARSDAPIDPARAVPAVAVARDLLGVAALGGAHLLLDEAGVPILLRDPALRPRSAVFLAEPSPTEPGDRLMVAALLIDAAASHPAEREEILRILDSLLVDPGGAPHASLDEEVGWVQFALTAAGILERSPGPARVLALLGATAADIPFGDLLVTLLRNGPMNGCAGLERSAEWIHSRWKPRASTALELLGTVPLEALARADTVALPIDVTPWLNHFGVSVPQTRRRGGRRARTGE